MTLAYHTQASKSKTILEVACGSGFHSLSLAKTLLRKGGALYCTDFAENMIQIAEARISDPTQGFTNNPANKVKF